LKVIDPERSWVAVERRMAVEADLRVRLLLENVRNHMRAELREQLDPLMATLVDDPIYHFHGMPGFESLRGRKAVEDYYRTMFVSGRMNAEFLVERIIADHDTVVTEGTMISLGRSNGVELAPLSGQMTSVIRTPLLVVWPAAADGRLIGENIYLGTAQHEELS